MSIGRILFLGLRRRVACCCVDQVLSRALLSAAACHDNSTVVPWLAYPSTGRVGCPRGVHDRVHVPLVTHKWRQWFARLDRASLSNEPNTSCHVWLWYDASAAHNGKWANTCTRSDRRSTRPVSHLMDHSSTVHSLSSELLSNSTHMLVSLPLIFYFI